MKRWRITWETDETESGWVVEAQTIFGAIDKIVGDDGRGEVVRVAVELVDE